MFALGGSVLWNFALAAGGGDRRPGVRRPPVPSGAGSPGTGRAAGGRRPRAQRREDALHRRPDRSHPGAGGGAAGGADRRGAWVGSAAVVLADVGAGTVVGAGSV